MLCVDLGPGGCRMVRGLAWTGGDDRWWRLLGGAIRGAISVIGSDWEGIGWVIKFEI